MEKCLKKIDYEIKLQCSIPRHILDSPRKSITATEVRANLEVYKIMHLPGIAVLQAHVETIMLQSIKKLYTLYQNNHQVFVDAVELSPAEP